MIEAVKAWCNGHLQITVLDKRLSGLFHMMLMIIITPYSILQYSNIVSLGAITQPNLGKRYYFYL